MGGMQQKRILFLVNHEIVIYNFRLELVERLIHDNYEVHISSPYGEKIEELMELGAIHHAVQINCHGLNPLTELKLISDYNKLIRLIHPDIILGYTIKPNIYGAIVAKHYKIPFLANITGLGTAVENTSIIQKFILFLYRYSFSNLQCVFFQNEENRQFFLKNHIIKGRYKLLPGSGVNLERFPLKEYPKDNIIRFSFVGRIIKEKGIDQYLEAAKTVKAKYPNTEFHVCGNCENKYKKQIEKLNADGIIIYHGMIRNVSAYLENIHCVVLPTYYPEGISNALLEACASGRPIITTDRSGCKEIVEDNINGYMIPQKNSTELISAIEKFIELPFEEKKKMGLNGRRKVEQEFNRRIVVDAYMREIRHNLGLEHINE